MRFFFGILFTLLLSATAAQNQKLGFYLTEGRRTTVIPFQQYNNLIIIPVTLNGVVPLNFIVDTGVRTALLLDRTVTDMLRLNYTRRFTISGPGGERLLSALVTNNVSLDVKPDLHGRGHSMLVLEKDYLELSKNIGFEVHGILGYELFSRFVVKIDYERRELVLTSPERFRKPRQFIPVPMRIEDTKPYISCIVTFPSGQAHELKLMVDTGASHSLLLDPKAGPEIEIPQKTISGNIGRALGGDLTGRTGRLKSFRAGPFQLNGLPASFPDANLYYDTLESTDVFRHGTIGGDVLHRFNLIFDYAGETLWVKKNSFYKMGFQFSLSGVLVQARGLKLDQFSVTDVRPGSPGWEAGLNAGDRLTRIYGTDAVSYKLNEIIEVLNAKPGRKVPLEIDRDGFRMRVVITLRDDL
ncbi:MAG: aspartyl protease family protein [Bacteroidota bacterium]